MLPNRLETWRWLALAVGLVALAMAALACAPIAPAGQGASAIPSLVPLEPGQQKPICTAETWFTDCIKPTFPPTDTPEPTPTIPPEIYGASGEDDDFPTATPVPLIDQVTDMVRDGEYDAIARVKVLSHRRVTVTTLTYDFFIAEWTRSRVKVTEMLRGDLPATFDIVIPAFFPNGALDVGGDYILFLDLPAFVDVGDAQFAGNQKRIKLNQTQMGDFGGEAGAYLGRQVWTVNGASVYRVPVEHITSYREVIATDLAIAKANGETMTLAALERILRPDDN